MAITKRIHTRVGADGKTTQRVMWRARIADPKRPGSASHKIERTFASKRDAQAWETAQRSAIASGTYITREAGSTTLAEVADSWRETWDAKPLSPRTQSSYETLLRVHVLPEFGDVKVSAIDAKSVQAWVNRLSKRSHAETVHHCYTTLRQCLKTAVAHKLIVNNPCTPDAITLPSKRAASATREQLFLTAPQLRDLVGAMHPHWQAATLLSGLCGTRAGETWALRRSDVDLLHRRLTIVFALKDVAGHRIVGPTKSHQRRSLSIPEPLVAPLQVLLDDPGVRVRPLARGRKISSGFPAIVNGELDWVDEPGDGDRLLFTSLGGGVVSHSNFVNRYFEPARNSLWPAGHRLSRLRWHDLRHTAASLAIAATGNLGIVQKRLGHSSISLTYDRYGHMLPEADKSLADALGSMYTADNQTNVVALGARPDVKEDI